MKDSMKKRVLAGSMAAALTGALLTGAYSCQGNVPETVQAEDEVQVLEEAAGEVIGVEEKAENAGKAESQSSGLDSESGESEEQAGKSEKQNGEPESKSGELSKEESVYVKADPSGNVTETTVTEWLKNPEKGAVEDTSGLENITNVKGEESFSQGNGDALTWQSEGKDIYYQGESSASLPVGVEVSYKLDGKSVSAEELNGKSGQAEITIRYTNNSREKVKIGEKTEELYTPFTMVTAMMLPTDEYSNVKVDNGRVISDGDRNIVLGVGMPGMKENLKFDDADLDIDIPESVTITADVQNASVGPTVTMASAETLNEFDLDEIESFDELEDSIDELEDAAGKLVDGSGDAADGAGKLADGTKTLEDGTNELKQGTGKLADGSKAVTNGIQTLGSQGRDLVNGVNALSAGVNEYVAGVGGLAQGSEKLSAGVAELKEGSDKLNALVNSDGQNAAGLGKSISSVESGTDKVQSGIHAASASVSDTIGMLKNEKAEVESIDTDGMKGEVRSLSEGEKSAIKSGVSTDISVSVDVPDSIPEEYRDEVRAAVEKAEKQAEQKAEEAVDRAADEVIARTCEKVEDKIEITGSPSAKASVDLDAEIAALERVQSTLSSDSSKLVSGMNQIDLGTEKANDMNEMLKQSVAKIAAGADEANSAAQELAIGAQKLNERSNLLTAGSDQLKKGVAQIPGGVKKLADGSKAVTAGAKALDQGAGELKKGADTLVKGTDALADGNRELADGMSEFKEKGIDEIAEAFNGDFQKIRDRLDAVTEIGKNYRSFAGIREGMDGSTKFIIETEGVDE